MECDLAAGTAAIGPEWQALTARALVPSGPNSPELMIPAFKTGGSARLAVVRDGDALRLALPLMARRFPLPFHANWSSPVNFHGGPHVDRDFAVPALTALLGELRQPLLLHSAVKDGALWEALAGAAGHMAVLETWERAVLRPSGTYGEWFEASFERKRRKEYRRLKARLAEQGVLEASTHEPGADPALWVDDFLALEAAGWKGDRGTAIASDRKAAPALREACSGLARSAKLRFWKLALDGRPIAMLYAIADGREAWLGKIAHDETLARFSPGVLLILHATEQLFAEGFAQVDSCAVPGHPMIDHLWRGRLTVADVMVAPSTLGASRFAATVAAERLRRRMRGRARDLFNSFTGRHRS